MNTPRGMQTQMFFNINIITAMRPSAAIGMKLSQISTISLDVALGLKIFGVIGCKSGMFKTSGGGFKVVKEIPL